jgi:hypothetical protein
LRHGGATDEGEAQNCGFLQHLLAPNKSKRRLPSKAVA